MFGWALRILNSNVISNKGPSYKLRVEMMNKWMNEYMYVCIVAAWEIWLGDRNVIPRENQSTEANGSMQKRKIDEIKVQFGPVWMYRWVYAFERLASLKKLWNANECQNHTSRNVVEQRNVYNTMFTNYNVHLLGRWECSPVRALNARKRRYVRTVWCTRW